MSAPTSLAFGNSGCQLEAIAAAALTIASHEFNDFGQRLDPDAFLQHLWRWLGCWRGAPPVLVPLAQSLNHFCPRLANQRLPFLVNNHLPGIQVATPFLSSLHRPEDAKIFDLKTETWFSRDTYPKWLQQEHKRAAPRNGMRPGSDVDSKAEVLKLYLNDQNQLDFKYLVETSTTAENWR